MPRGITIVNRYKGPGGGAYFLGFLGAFIYYMQTAATFGDGVIGFLKALVWPAFLVYHIYKFLGLQ
ncbi:MAG: hypothetical protein HZB70_02005 [Candidatus Berkelbacteria bacterium]|nr:MAG: hypothetical protein HZB70_02005 [Candidatus Berkelbacteria bacterium]QQG52146.1 MAG: hypothetical protein HY845_00990 [Candidatus Berkelbacteria bacterium]